MGLTGYSSTMTDELIDLTTMQPKLLRARFTPTNLMWIVVVGGVPYLAREAFRYFFPRRPTVVDQLKVLAELIAAAGEAKAKSLKVRISTAANTRWELPEPIQEAKVLSENVDTIDLEIVLREHQPWQAGNFSKQENCLCRSGFDVVDGARSRRRIAVR
jgi:hypothetical protein